MTIEIELQSRCGEFLGTIRLLEAALGALSRIQEEAAEELRTSPVRYLHDGEDHDCLGDGTVHRLYDRVTAVMGYTGTKVHEAVRRRRQVSESLDRLGVAVLGEDGEDIRVPYAVADTALTEAYSRVSEALRLSAINGSFLESRWELPSGEGYDQTTHLMTMVGTCIDGVQDFLRSLTCYSATVHDIHDALVDADAEPVYTVRISGHTPLMALGDYDRIAGAMGTYIRSADRECNPSDLETRVRNLRPNIVDSWSITAITISMQLKYALQAREHMRGNLLGNAKYISNLLFHTFVAETNDIFSELSVATGQYATAVEDHIHILDDVIEKCLGCMTSFAQQSHTPNQAMSDGVQVVLRSNASSIKNADTCLRNAKENAIRALDRAIPVVREARGDRIRLREVARIAVAGDRRRALAQADRDETTVRSAIESLRASLNSMSDHTDTLPSILAQLSAFEHLTDREIPRDVADGMAEAANTAMGSVRTVLSQLENVNRTICGSCDTLAGRVDSVGGSVTQRRPDVRAEAERLSPQIAHTRSAEIDRHYSAARRLLRDARGVLGELLTYLTSDTTRSRVAINSITAMYEAAAETLRGVHERMTSYNAGVRRMLSHGDVLRTLAQSARSVAATEVVRDDALRGLTQSEREEEMPSITDNTRNARIVVNDSTQGAVHYAVRDFPSPAPTSYGMDLGIGEWGGDPVAQAIHERAQALRESTSLMERVHVGTRAREADVAPRPHTGTTDRTPIVDDKTAPSLPDHTVLTNKFTLSPAYTALVTVSTCPSEDSLNFVKFDLYEYKEDGTINSTDTSLWRFTTFREMVDQMRAFGSPNNGWLWSTGRGPKRYAIEVSYGALYIGQKLGRRVSIPGGDNPDAVARAIRKHIHSAFAKSPNKIEIGDVVHIKGKHLHVRMIADNNTVHTVDQFGKKIRLPLAVLKHGIVYRKGEYVQPEFDAMELLATEAESRGGVRYVELLSDADAQKLVDMLYKDQRERVAPTSEQPQETEDAPRLRLTDLAQIQERLRSAEDLTEPVLMLGRPFAIRSPDDDGDDDYDDYDDAHYHEDDEDWGDHDDIDL